MVWLQIDQDFPSLRENWHLERLLGVSNPTVCGHVLKLLLWAVGAAKDGRLPEDESWALEKAAGWEGEPGVMVKALLTVGWLDREEDDLVFRDWEDYGGKIIEARRQATERQRRSRARASGLASEERPNVTRESRVCDGADKRREDKQEKKERKDIDNRDKTGVPGGPSSFFNGSGSGEPGGGETNTAAETLLAFPQWTLREPMTYYLLAQLADEHPGVDQLREVNAWRSYVLERGEPITNCQAALRGWFKNANAAPRDAGRGEQGAMTGSFLGEIAKHMDMEAALNGSSD